MPWAKRESQAQVKNKSNSSYKKAFRDVREEEIHAETFGITDQLNSFLGVLGLVFWGRGRAVFVGRGFLKNKNTKE